MTVPSRQPEHAPANPYLLLTPGPLSTSPSVKATMLRDWCTWDADYNSLVQEIRSRLVSLAETGQPTADLDNLRSSQYTATLMQGSGTFCVESVIGTVPEDGKLLVAANGAYGERIARIASYYRIDTEVVRTAENEPVDAAGIEQALTTDPAITHVALVHGETTTGLLNPVADVAAVTRAADATLILDAMSTFGGVPIDPGRLGIDFLISSANKCIQGVPGFGFILARRTAMEKCEGRSRSLSLDLFDQWQTMENAEGKWRFTSPTHTVRAFLQALRELEEEGGTVARHARYVANQQVLASGMTSLGFRPFLDPVHQSPIITAFHTPQTDDFCFQTFYDQLKSSGFVIYPGKVSDADTFRIGSIGDLHPSDMERLIDAVSGACYWKQ